MENITNKIPPHSAETLQQYLIEMNKTKKDLENIRSKLGDMLDHIDKELVTQGINWAEHREKYYNDLVEALKSLGIALTAEEISMLRSSGSTASSIAEIRNKLKILKIKVPDNASDFTVIACDVVAAALSRTLKKIDNAYDIVDKVNIISKESKDTDKFKAQYKKQLDDIMKDITVLKNELTNILVVDPQKLTTVDQIKDGMRHEKEAEVAAENAAKAAMEQSNE